MRIVAIANQKGGCGKTTTAVNLAGCLAFLGKRVLLIDLDAQGHATLGLGVEGPLLERTLYDALSPRAEGPLPFNEIILKISRHVHLAPADLTLSALEQELSGVPGREGRLTEAFAAVGEPYDYVFIDCAPGLGILMFNALHLADEVLVPVEPSIYSLHGLARFMETVRLAEQEFGKDYRVHALITCYDGRTKVSRQALEQVREQLGEVALTTAVRRNVRLADAAGAGRPISEFDRSSTGFKDYMAACSELIERGAQAALRDGRTDSRMHTLARDGELDRAIERVQRIIEESSEAPEVAAAPTSETAAAVESEIAPEEEKPDGAGEEAAIELRFRSDAVQEPPPEREGGFEVAHLPDADNPFLELRLRGPIRVREGMLFTLLRPGPADVRIAGEFNDWKPEPMACADDEKGVWEITKQLASGAYRYKFVINGEWINDPHNRDVQPNPFGGLDSVIHIAP